MKRRARRNFESAWLHPPLAASVGDTDAPNGFRFERSVDATDSTKKSPFVHDVKNTAAT